MLAAVMAISAWAQTAEDIIAKNIDAQGGRKALAGLKSVQRKGEVKVDGSFGAMEGTVEEVVIPGKKAVRALDLAVFQQKDGWNGEVAWREGMMGLQDLEGPEANQIKQMAELNPFLKMADGAKAEKLDDETVKDVSYYVIQVTPAEGPAVKHFIDKESNQIARSTLKQNNPMFGEIEIVVEQAGYEQFGPVKLATKNNAKIGDVFEIQTTYTETKVDEKVDEALFEKPQEEKPKDADKAKDDKPKDEKSKEAAK
jgi:hypothetical protein